MNGFFVGDIIADSFARQNLFFHKKNDKRVLFDVKSNFSSLSLFNFASMSWLLKEKFDQKEMIKISKRIYSKFLEFNIKIKKIDFDKQIFNNSKQIWQAQKFQMSKVPAIGWYSTSIKEIKELVSKTCISLNEDCTISKYCEVYAVAIFMLKNNIVKKSFIKYLKDNYDYDLKKSLNDFKKEIGKNNDFKKILKLCLISVMDSCCFEEAIRNVEFMRKNKDFKLICGMTGSLAEAYFQEVPALILKDAKDYLPNYFKNIVTKFKKKVTQKSK